MPAARKGGFNMCALVVNFILVVILVFGGVAVYLHQVKYKGGTHWYHPTDMIDINSMSSDMSSTWCNGYKVSGDKATSFSVYLLPYSSTRLDPYNRTLQSVNMEDIEAGSKDQALSLFLLEGTTLKIDACRKHIDRLDNVSSQVLLFRGGGFKTWESNMNCKTCYIKHFPITAWCNKNQTNTSSFTIATRDTYSIVLARVNSSRVGKKVYVLSSVTLNKTRYYTDDAIQSCLDKNECTVNLDYATDRDVIVEIGANPQVYDAYFDSHCQDRVILWVGVFLLIPGFLIFAVLAAITLGELYLKRRQAQSSTSDPETPSQGYAKMNDGDELITN
ncbi:uncharacterized protein LOC121374098 [Gigantopelta aegis]|uniref:uncharacterized protein LOC121374098 n=1 Tax=Gigantopelta aegis TaxID=1735272 RepID=UPI001B88D0A3|nr:uncharacterized protein LOC121374098 [Gigantopelta aegis]XP_041356968.1 uncharacterized protein LOC121374098 [Gigantopelta aegis]XP_041356976.1 uncharacterized protein LOC121374098 [Gigantopelta aegis]XP_041356984.1 uncharacterized protein LOC121374098 [Gigantopelta aegis]